MGRERISKLLLHFSGPAILAVETTAFYNLFDAIWCGHLAPEALAALTVSNPLMAIYRARALAISLQNTLSFFFQGIGKALPSLIIASSRQLIFLVPCLLIIPSLLGLSGLWIACPIADALSIVRTLTWTITEFRRLNIPVSQLLTHWLPKISVRKQSNS